MTDLSNNNPQVDGGVPATKKTSNPWPKRITLGFSLGFVFLVLAYFGVGSAFFVRTFVLPAVESAMVAKVSAEDISFSPLSGIELGGLKFAPADQETMVSAQRVRVTYSLGDIIGGTIKLNQLHLENPTVTIIEREDGNSNLTDWLNSLPPSPDAPLPKMDLNDLGVTKGKVVYRKLGANQSGSQLEIDLSTVQVSRIGQDLSGSIQLQSLIRMLSLDGSIGSPEEVLATQLALEGDLDLNDALFPKKSSLNGSIKVQSTSADYVDLQGLEGGIVLSLQSDSIEDASITFSKNNQTAGSIHLSGPMNFTTLEGDLELALRGLNRQFLNLAGAMAGMDFGETLIDGTLSCKLSKGGSQIAISAVTSAKNLSVKMDGMALPAMDTELKLAGLFDAEQQSVVIREWNLTASNDHHSWLEGSIDKAITLSWGAGPENFQTSTFHLALKQMDLQPWKSLLGDVLTQGEMNGELDIAFLQQGKQIQANGRSLISKANFMVSEQSLTDQHLKMEGRFILQDFKRLLVEQSLFEWSNASQEVLVSATSLGAYQLDGKGLNVQVEASANLPLMQSLLPTDGGGITKGTGGFSARVKQQDSDWSGTLQTSLTDMTGRVAGFDFEDYTVQFEAKGGLRGNNLNLETTQLKFREGFNEGGVIHLEGNLDVASMQGKLGVRSEEVNHYALKPLLRAYAEPEKLKEVGFGLNAELDLNLAAESSFQGTADLNNLPLERAVAQSNQPVKTALEWDLGWTADQLDIRNSTLKLTPTAKAGNTLRLTGRLPMQPTLASKASLSLESASMDLTSYMNLFMVSSENEPEPVATASLPDQGTPNPSPQESKPMPLDVPLGELDARVNIGKLFARDLSVQDFQARMLWQTNTMHLEPVSMTVNEGPVQAALHMDFTQPDWGYRASFDVQKVPVQAITDTLDPANKGKVSGIFTAKGDWTGVGLMEPSLQRNLSGSMSIQYADANIELVSPTVRLLMTPITALLRLPELMKAPINGLEANVSVQDQKLALSETKVLSDAFQVHTSGEIPLANVLTNSVLNLPVEFHLKRSIAQKSNLIPSNAPKDTPFVKLPDFVTMTGTVGKPVTKTDKLVLSGLLIKSAAGLPLNVGEGAVNALKGVGNFLVGDPGKSENQGAGTDEANEKPASGILEQVNPFKLFNQLGGDRKKAENETPKEEP